MSDVQPSPQRSAIMRAIRSKDTAPELTVRRALFKLGYRYRLHLGNLPGAPDIVFTKRRKVIFVHGCFWHQHQGCRHGHTPSSNKSYWENKLTRNSKRDANALTALAKGG